MSTRMPAPRAPDSPGGARQAAAPFVVFERALPHQVRDALSRAPIAYVPLGSLEWHGEHAALGLDGIKAAWICEQAARRSGGVLFPTMQWGAFHTLPFPFTFAFSRRCLQRQIRRTLESLARWGFRSLVLLTGHYPLAQIALLRRECRRVSRRHGVGALGIPEQALALDHGYLGDHAAKWETSYMLALGGDLVDQRRLRQNPDGTTLDMVDQPRPPQGGTWWFEKNPSHPWYGLAANEGNDPTAASAELGRTAVAAIIDWARPRILEARGLDVSAPLRRQLAGAGDPESAALLARIYDDEIGHVAAGTLWFRAVCHDSGIDPEARFLELLARHRGSRRRRWGPVDRAGRTAAGFSERELAALDEP